MYNKLKGIAAISLAFTISIATLPQISLGYKGGISVRAEEAKASDELQSSIAALMNAHDSKYDYMKDSKYMELMNKLGTSLLTQYSKELDGKLGTHFTIGNLDGDNIPEIVVFEQRDSNDLKDEGALALYKYKEGTYTQIDRISMNFDNTCVNLVIGQAAKGKNAVFVNTSVGAHSEDFYLFTIENDKFKSRINEKKARLLSVYTSAQIKDIDKDGILEFSVYDIDPESSDSSSAGSDKINIWYKWDGKDGVKFIKYEKTGTVKKAKTDTAVVSRYNSLITKGDLANAYSYLKTNKAKLSLKDNSDAVTAYLTALNKKLNSMNSTFYKYQEKYKMFENQGIMKKYKLKADDLNNTNIIKKTSIFSKEKDVKNLLLSANSIGLKVGTYEGSYYFVINYQKLLDLGASTTSDISDYLKIFAADSNKPGLAGEYVKIQLDELASRIASMEKFTFMYPYSKYVSEVNQKHEAYLRAYIFATYDFSSQTVSAATIKSYEKSIKDYDYLVLSDILKVYMEGLKESGNKVTKNLLDKMNQVISDNK